MKLLLRSQNHFYTGSKLLIVSDYTFWTWLLKKVFAYISIWISAEDSTVYVDALAFIVCLEVGKS